MDGEIIPPGLPALVEPSSGVRDARTGLMDGTTGTRTSWNMAGAYGSFGMMSPGMLGYGPNSGMIAASRLPQHREGAMVANISAEMVNASPILTAIVDSLIVNAIGTGLKLSSKINAAGLGITPDEAEELSSTIERRFNLWAGNPVEVDLAGRSTLHQLAAAGYRHFVLGGELLAVLDAKRTRGARTLTKVALLDPSQLDRTHTRSGDGFSSFQGVHFDAAGSIAGYWLRRFVPGSQNIDVNPKFVNVRTHLGRTLVVHAFDLQAAGQVRGLSPLVSALTTVLEEHQLAEYTLEAARIQTAYAMFIKSASSSEAVFRNMQSDDFPSWLAQRDDFYKQNPPVMKPGQLGALAPGDEVEVIRSETPNSVYPHFTADMVRKAAKAAGANPEHVSGDYSKANFASSRLAEEVPYRHNVRRREAVAVPFYQRVYENWLEEQIESGQIRLPANAPPFWQARAEYSEAKWIGPPKIVADALKQNQADVLELGNGLATLSGKLAERGHDVEAHLRELAAEMKLKEKLGLPTHYFGTISTVHRIQEEDPAGTQDK